MSDERLPFGDRRRVLFSRLRGTQLPLLSLGCTQRSWASPVLRGGMLQTIFSVTAKKGRHTISRLTACQGILTWHWALGVSYLLSSSLPSLPSPTAMLSMSFGRVESGMGVVAYKW